ncbi:MAG: AEC family transporter [Thermosipho sp. (in: Bacteria)]|nr:AEC family transporter [Thermosipho sp. (in: thermotogales)]
MIESFTNILPPFLLILIGYIFGRIFPFDIKIVSKISLWLLATTVAFTFINDYPPSLINLKDYGIGVLLVFLISFLFSRFSKTNRDVILTSGTYVNSGYLGYPILFSLWGEKAMSYGVIYAALNTIVASIFLPIFIGEKVNVKNVLKLPYIYTILAAYILGINGISYKMLPKPLFETVLMIKNSAIPFLLLFVGLSLSRIKFEKSSLKDALYSTVLRLVIVPVFSLVFIFIYNMDSELSKVFVLESSMPTAVNSVLLIDALNGNTSLISFTVFTTTLLSVITIPIWAFLLENIF